MNSESPQLGDLISRHFDDAASSAETATLAEHLTSDPGAALEFVRAARVHSLMERIARPQAAGRSRILRHWAAFGAAAAVIAAAAGAALFFWRSPLASSYRPAVFVQDAGEHRGDRKPLPPGVKLRTVKNFAADTVVPPAKLEFLLSNYYVHADPHGETVPAALRLLEKAIREANLFHRPELAALKFTAGPSVIPPILKHREKKLVPELSFRPKAGDFSLEPGPEIASPLRPPFTISEYLRICGLYREVIQEPGGACYAVEFTSVNPLDDTTPGERLTARTFRMSPDLFSRWLPRDSFEFPRHSTFGTSFGVSLNNNESLSISDDLSTLVVKSSEAKLDRIEQILDVCSQRKAVQHYLTTKYILCRPELLPAGFDAATGILLNDAEFQFFCRRLSVEPGVDLATASRIILRPGQASEIQILQEVPGRPPVEPLQSDWFGLRQEVLTTPVGETIQISGMVDFGFPAASGMVPFSEIVEKAGDMLSKYGAEAVTHHRTGFDLWVPDRYTALFTLDVETGGRGVAVACITASLVHPDGP